MTPRKLFMVLVNSQSGSVFVKDYDFFVEQHGMLEKWGEDWVPVVATSVEEARKKGCLLDGARPYERQASAQTGVES